jgi:hypothetical protein
MAAVVALMRFHKCTKQVSLTKCSTSPASVHFHKLADFTNRTICRACCHEGIDNGRQSTLGASFRMNGNLISAMRTID